MPCYNNNQVSRNFNPLNMQSLPDYSIGEDETFMASTAQIQAMAKTMDDLLNGKVISHIHIPYAQCANLDEYAFNQRTCGAAVWGVYHRKKWLVVKLSRDERILIHLGFNANVLFQEKGASLPKRFDVKMEFDDGTSFTIKYWMGGKFWLSADHALPASLRAREYMREIFEQRFPCEGAVNTRPDSRP